ncbi:MAG: PKD domain-containing protein [Gammaproteobacteria bacterium]|nr:PKD domain-containing protein [Gammaproteobacteria bacterium]
MQNTNIFKRQSLAPLVCSMLLSVVVAPANARMELKTGGQGDILLFPVFIKDFDNNFTITNHSDGWLQGFLRFRGAGWSSELLGFPIILSPFDTFRFRLADIDGDGLWEIDQSLSPENFTYTSLTRGCNGAISLENCMDSSTALEPGAVLDESLRGYHRTSGYVEFIGEARLDGMSMARMEVLLESAATDADFDRLGMGRQHRSGIGTDLGTNAWRWSDAANGFAADLGLSDFPNAVSGTVLISTADNAVYLAYNAEALQNFRTNAAPVLPATATHRINNYTRNTASAFPHPAASAVTQNDNNAVILNHGSSARSDEQYTYRFTDFIGDGGTANYEQRISYINTWGATLADGDDYDLTGLRTMNPSGEDDYDELAGITNSIAEVEEAIRAKGQNFSSYYFDGDVYDQTAPDGNGVNTAAVTSWFVDFFPTKIYATALTGFSSASRLQDYIDQQIPRHINRAKVLRARVCDVGENCAGMTMDNSVIIELRQDLSAVDIASLKTNFAGANERRSGIVMLEPDANANNPLNFPMESFPGLMYTLEAGSNSSLKYWRPLATGSAATPPHAIYSATPTSGVVPVTVTLDGRASIPSGEAARVVNFRWQSSDGQIAQGAVASITFAQTGIFDITLAVTDDLGYFGQTGVGAQTRITVTEQVLLGSGKAVIIAAGGAQSENTLFEYSNDFTQRIYRLLKKRGFNDESIYYMNPRAPDIEQPLDGRLEEERLDYALFDPEQELTEAFAQAAAKLAPGQQFVFYLHGHARQDNFLIMPDYELSASRLRDLLAVLPAGIRQIIILDSCYSGSFLDELAGVQERIVIASSNDETSAWSAQHASFTDKFLRQLRRGETLHQAFLTAEEMIIGDPALFREQRPWLDDDADGLYSSSDGAQAAQIYLGEEGISGAPPPAINTVHERINLSAGETAATLWVRTTPSQSREQSYSDSPLQQVRGILVSPGFAGSNYEGEATRFERLELELFYNSAQDRYEAVYDRFNIAGIWRVLYQAQDREGAWSDAVNGEVQVAAATDRSVRIKMSLNQSRYAADEPLLLDMNVSGSGKADMYAAIVFPDGNFITIIYPLNFSWPGTIQVYQAGVTIDGSRIYPIMDSPLPVGAAKGSYSACGVLTNAGSDPSDAANWQDFDCSGFELY